MKYVPLLMILAAGLSGCDAAKDLGLGFRRTTQFKGQRSW